MRGLYDPSTFLPLRQPSISFPFSIQPKTGHKICKCLWKAKKRFKGCKKERLSYLIITKWGQKEKQATCLPIDIKDQGEEVLNFLDSSLEVLNRKDICRAPPLTQECHLPEDAGA